MGFAENLRKLVDDVGDKAKEAVEKTTDAALKGKDAVADSLMDSSDERPETDPKETN